MIGPGASVDGYRIERMLGRGGMGVVYEAVQSPLERRVALKVLRAELAEDPEFVERFRREARLQAAVEHPHVLDVYEVGESPEGLFLAMRLVRGRTLIDLLRAGELEAERALRFLGQAADALDAAHALGLIHGDVKPQNVLVEGDKAFLADFGLTRAGEETTGAATRRMLGTVAYISPEVVRGEPPTPASDRYAFGATLFHCITGDVPFPRGSAAAALYAHAAEPPPRASERRPELPAELDDVFAQVLAKDPGRRPSTASAIVKKAREAIGVDRVPRLASPDLAGRRDPTPVTIPAAADRADVVARRPGTSIALAAAALALVAAFGIGAGALLFGDEEDPEAPLPAPTARAEVLGSDLAVPDRSLGCRGEPARPNTPPCAIVQSALPGAQLRAPADGAIVGWTVRGAQGEVALDVLRHRGAETTRVARSQWEVAGNAAPHRFGTRLAVERGDYVGVELGPGAAVGVSDASGAATQRWLRPAGGAYGKPDRGPGSGFDYEIAVRAEFVPGARVTTPPRLSGREARTAPDGRVRIRKDLEISDPRTTVTVELVEVQGRVALDVIRSGQRAFRMFIPDLEPRGVPVALRTYAYPGESVGEADVWWVNPNSGRMIFHFFGISPTQIEFWG